MKLPLVFLVQPLLVELKNNQLLFNGEIWRDRDPFKEDMVPRPQDPYGIAKYAAEQTLECLSKVHDIDFVTLVPHNIIGPRQKYDDPYRNVASIMINRCLQGMPPIIYGDGSQTRCFLLYKMFLIV